MSEATMAGEACLDLETLKKRCLGNLDLVDRVLRKFSTQLDSDLVELERALTASDTETFALVAHRVKGMSANVEARDLYRNAAAAEERAHAQRWDELPTCLEGMQMQRDRIAESLPRLRMTSLT